MPVTNLCKHCNNGHVEVEYIPAHNGHALGHNELKHLPLPGSVQDEVLVAYQGKVGKILNHIRHLDRLGAFSIYVNTSSTNHMVVSYDRELAAPITCTPKQCLIGFNPCTYSIAGRKRQKDKRESFDKKKGCLDQGLHLFKCTFSGLVNNGARENLSN